MPISDPIVVPLLAPAAGAFAVALAGAGQRARAIAIAATAVAFLAASWMWVRLEPRGAEWQFARHVDLVPASGLRAIAGVDGFALSLVLVVTLVAAACAVWTIGRAVDDRTRSVWVALLSMETGVVGVLVSLDLLQALVFWAVAMAAALRAIGVETGRPARRLVMLASLAAIAFASAVMGLEVKYRALSGFGTFDLRALQTLPLTSGVQLWLLAALLPALALPLSILGVRIHAADERAHAPCAESIPVIVCLSSLLLPLAMYGLVRVGMTILPGAVRLASPYLIAACALAVLAAAVTAIRKPRDFGVLVLSGGVIACGLALAAVLTSTPSTITWGVVLQIAQSLGVAAVLLAATSGHRLGEAPARHAGLRSALVLAPLTIAIAVLALLPGALLARLETSVARVVLRVSPEYAPQVADCLSQPPKPPDPAETGLPAGMVIAAPCAEGQPDAHGKK